MNISARLQSLHSRVGQYQPTHEELAAARLVLIEYFARCQSQAPTEAQSRALELLIELFKAPTSARTLERALAFANVIPSIKLVTPYIEQAKSSAPPQVRRAFELIFGDQK